MPIERRILTFFFLCCRLRFVLLLVSLFKPFSFALVLAGRVKFRMFALTPRRIATHQRHGIVAIPFTAEHFILNPRKGFIASEWWQCIHLFLPPANKQLLCSQYSIVMKSCQIFSKVLTSFESESILRQEAIGK